ncbi:type VI toxin-antitoxin system SocB family DNA replication inhibitor toxin [Pseudonocardia sp. TMWB2A]|uniref:type VI toxin-antitoxin system SocB family DNA replication inhibitor toxin n=1 Tax=Pseudonocardia sp. TMWB2A TaxID=687430 RepID=UPI00307CF1DC
MRLPKGEWMKLRRLPEIDLAKVAHLPAEEKRIRLRRFGVGGGGWSYDPARSQSFTVVNPRDPLGLSANAPKIENILKIVRQACRCDNQEIACLDVIKLFHSWCSENVTDAIERQLPAMSIGSWGSVRYWENFILVVNGKPTQVFTDHRRGTSGLDFLARKFVFSMMHEHTRSVDPDMLDAERLILKFPQHGKKDRQIAEYFASEVGLYSFEELSAMIDETYKIWIEVEEERQAAPPKRRAAGGSLL